MAAPRGRPWVWLTAALLLPPAIVPAQAGDRIDNIHQVFEWMGACWKPPPASRANPEIDITVVVSFMRDGNINGQPKITYESEQATDNDRLEYRIAVMEALQRCTPMPFTEGMAGAIAGRPFAFLFRHKTHPPQPIEKRAWLTTKIL